MEIAESMNKIKTFHQLSWQIFLIIQSKSIVLVNYRSIEINLIMLLSPVITFKGIVRNNLKTFKIFVIYIIC